MSLRKKIIFGFLISALIISILAAFEYINFLQVRNEMGFLEVSDSIRSRSLQLRRHEKNFFLFREQAASEAAQTRDYLDELDEITADIKSGDPRKIAELRGLVSEYRAEFTDIERLIQQISGQLQALQGSFAAYPAIYPLIESDSRDKPAQVAGFLVSTLAVPPDNPLITNLTRLDSDISKLRDTGENILTASEGLDIDARDSADNGIRLSQVAIVVFFPLFLVFGLGALFYIGTDVVKRLRTLTEAVDMIGQRYAHGTAPPSDERGKRDEVDTLIYKFQTMNSQLMDWEEELDEKNQELMQSKKLAAIGTLAAGVAHELNNPLNNISLSAQVLRKQLRGDEPSEVKEIINDIVAQTTRVKGIVGNLLEFAREREPQLVLTDLGSVIQTAYRQVQSNTDVGRINFVLDPDDADLALSADPNQLERAFVNLFTNAVSAMNGEGQLGVRIEPGDEDTLRIYVSDTGAGISPKDREKVFDPFFTRKEKGTGLGLAIVLNIINNHQGHIAVVSEPGMGTVFEIILPKGQK